MSITQFFRPKPKVGLHHTFQLTPLGKTKAEEFALSGVKWQVLAILNENGASSAEEVASEAKLSTEKVKTIFKALLRSGYITRVGNGD